MSHRQNMSAILALLTSTLAMANVEEIPLVDKPLFGLAYDFAPTSTVDRFLHHDKKSDLLQLHRASLELSYPYFHYLQLGFSLDYTLARSPKKSDPRLDISRASTKISSTFLSISARIRPQFPVTFGNWDLILYMEAQPGVGTSSPITFGTHPLSDYQYKETSNFPTIFPLMFETTPKIGAQIFGWRFIGLELACGFRIMWIVHPMVSVQQDRLKESRPPDKRKAIWYDVTAPFIQAGVKFAF
jgi:hypothetical protein